MLRYTTRISRVRRAWSTTSCSVSPRSALPSPILRNGRNNFILRAYSSSSSSSGRRSRRKPTAPKTVPPSQSLRILFCGSDDFSAASLIALEEARRADAAAGGNMIESIEVVVRPGKRTGRGLAAVSEVPLKRIAEKAFDPPLVVHVLENDTFTGWNPPAGRNYNLIVAVSFGLFVPPRLLRAARYGGLNVHPSLLPAYRGPAPLHRQLLEGVEKVGVTLQTLDEAAFDRGEILDRRVIRWPALNDRDLDRDFDPKPDPDLAGDDLAGTSNSTTTRIPRNCTVPQLAAAAGAAGAQMLVQALRAERHVLEVRAQSPRLLPRMRGASLYAAKITAWDRQFPPTTWNKPRSLARRQRVVGPLWFLAKALDFHPRPHHPGSSRDKGRGSGMAGVVKRIIVDQIEEVDVAEVRNANANAIANANDAAATIHSSLPKKWVYRKMNRIYRAPPPEFKAERGAKEAKAKAEVKEGERGEPPAPAPSTPITTVTITTTRALPQEPIPLYYWTAAEGEASSDGAIYISPYNPPSEQTETYVRIPTLKVEGETAKPAAAVAAAFGELTPLPPLVWRRASRLRQVVDFQAHVAHELRELVLATSRTRLLDPDFVSMFTSSSSSSTSTTSSSVDTTTTTATATATTTTPITDVKDDGNEDDGEKKNYDNNNNNNNNTHNHNYVRRGDDEALSLACNHLYTLLEIHSPTLSYINHYFELEGKKRRRRGGGNGGTLTNDYDYDRNK